MAIYLAIVPAVKGIPVTDLCPSQSSTADLRLKALSRWDNEGGAGRAGPQEPNHEAAFSDVPPLSNAELVQLRIRTIALENLMIMVLSEGSDDQLGRAREMAAYIAPRSGFTHHPLTEHAAAHIDNLVDRAIHYRDADKA